jgi:hypothetical protein
MNKKLHRPRGIFPSLPGGMDNVIKIYYDKYRKLGKLPPEIENKVKGKLLSDVKLMTKWRNWRTGLEYHDAKRDAVLFGALDDCLVDGNFYIPLDYKTRGSSPKDGTSEEYYGNQLSCYNLLLKENGFKVRDYGFLVYYYPKSVRKDGLVQFSVKPLKIKADAETGRETFEKAVKLLKSKEPKQHTECEYCNWGDLLLNEYD